MYCSWKSACMDLGKRLQRTKGKHFGRFYKKNLEEEQFQWKFGFVLLMRNIFHFNWNTNGFPFIYIYGLVWILWISVTGRCYKMICSCSTKLSTIKWNSFIHNSAIDTLLRHYEHIITIKTKFDQIIIWKSFHKPYSKRS